MMNSPLTKNYWVLGLLGAVTGVISLTPEILILGRDSNIDTERHARMDISRRSIYTPILWAIVAAGIGYLLNTQGPDWSKSYWVLGLLLSLIIPSFKAVNNYAQDVYQITTTRLYATDLIFYTLLWGVGIQSLAKALLLSDGTS